MLLKHSGDENVDILNYLDENGKSFMIDFLIQFTILFFYVLIKTIVNYHENTLFILSVFSCIWTAFQSSIILSFIIIAAKIFYNVVIIKKHYKKINKQKMRKKIFKIIK